LLEKTKKQSEFFGHPFNIYTVIQAHQGLCLGGLGNFKEGKHALDKVFIFSSKINHPYTMATLELDYSGFYAFMGHRENVIKHAQKSIKYSEQADAVTILGMDWALLGFGYYLLGKFQAALKYIKKGLKIQTDLGLLTAMSWYYSYLCQVHMALGELRKAQNCIEEAINLSKKNNETHYEAHARTLLGGIIAKVDPTRLKKAENEILQGIKILDELKFRPYSAQGHLCLGALYTDAGQQEKAIANLEKARSMFQDMGMNFWLARTYALCAEFNKHQGDEEKTRKNMNKAIDIFKECGADGWVEKYAKEPTSLS
jgi:tetratricopeptide (TPR) repeat protein